ncbi:MAG: hypothetical protein K2L11_03140 [Muribaculaceae bacterium]|nr:hypothetical protein [Muribaculaceae bacterium]
MKRIFTCICKLTLLLSFLSLAFSASAEEYKSMIRYDRVWEHLSVHWDDKTAFYTKFDGAEEINGKTYHRLVSFRKATYDYDKDGQCYIIDVDENYYRHEGYLREEEGKVYTLISNVVYSDDRYFGHLYIPSGGEAHPSDLEEKLLYDFTCKEGDTYVGLHVFAETEEMVFKVRAVESVEIDGESHRLMLVSPEDYDYIELPIVEGIGLDSEYGCLTTINFLYIPTCPCTDHIFNRVLSIDGKVLYPREDNRDRIPVADFLGVDNVIDNTKDKNASIYDMLGRRISSPASGQLYIRDGRKYVAP